MKILYSKINTVAFLSCFVSSTLFPLVVIIKITRKVIGTLTQNKPAVDKEEKKQCEQPESQKCEWKLKKVNNTYQLTHFSPTKHLQGSVKINKISFKIEIPWIETRK